MRRIALAVAALAGLTLTASAQYNPPIAGWGTGSNPDSHYVNPYIRNDGVVVGGHYQTNPNNTQLDNYQTRGNLNPYNDHVGRRSPYR